MRNSRLARLLLGAGLLATEGCNNHPLDPFENVVTAVNRQENALPAKTKIDFLFMVDNSGSMCQEQRNLTENFTAFSTFLFDELQGSADFRLAVITTDLERDDAGQFLSEPAPAVPALNCLDRDTGEPITPDTQDCQGLDLDPIIKSGRDGNITSKDDLELHFRCLATLGTGGDGFEKGLESMRQALSCAGPNRERFGECCARDANGQLTGEYDPRCTIPEGEVEPEFLRPDALLVVVFITDEDDCSDPASNPRSSGSEACGGEPCRIERDYNSNCQWNREDLVPVDDYVRFLNSLKPQPQEQLLVAAVVGHRQFTPDGFELNYIPGPDASDPDDPANPACDPNAAEYDPTLSLDECCPMGLCSGRPMPSCTSNNGEAFSGRRYLELAERFGANGIGCPEGKEPGGPDEDASECVHICVNDFAGPLGRIKDRVASLVGSYCLDKAPECTVPDGEGGTRPCAGDELDDPANYNVQVRLQCLRTEDQGGRCPEIQEPRLLARTEFDLLLDEGGCASGALVQLKEPPVAGSDVILQFTVAVAGQ